MIKVKRSSIKGFGMCRFNYLIFLIWEAANVLFSSFQFDYVACIFFNRSIQTNTEMKMAQLTLLIIAIHNLTWNYVDKVFDQMCVELFIQ